MKNLMGFARADGQFGIRNHIVVLSGVQCANVVVDRICALTGAAPIKHDRGCIEKAYSHELTRLALIRAGQHPNVYGALVVSLGCEQTDTKSIAEAIAQSGRPVHHLVVQDFPSMEAAAAEGARLVQSMQAEAAKLQRVPMPFEKLVVATQCGGSDWTTALSGNTTIGRMSEMIVDRGGAVLISEVGGFPGSEHILAENAASPQVGRAILDMVAEIRQAFIEKTGVSIESVNPTTGNKAGGITTLVEKSMGNIKKIGHTSVQGVVKVGDPIPHGGSWIIDNRGEGPDSINTTGFAMSGAHITVFSSGRGTPIGNALMPVIKLTGNPDRYELLKGFLDFNAGPVLQGESLDKVGEELLDLVVETVLGRETISERNGCKEFTIPYRQ